MYCLFYCPDFTAPGYQLGYFADHGHTANGWFRTPADAISNGFSDHYDHYDKNITTPEARMLRFCNRHNGSKSIHLIAQAPTIEDIVISHPELFI